jgi:hypothetical protein
MASLFILKDILLGNFYIKKIISFNLSIYFLNLKLEVFIELKEKKEQSMELNLKIT